MSSLALSVAVMQKRLNTSQRSGAYSSQLLGLPYVFCVFLGGGKFLLCLALGFQPFPSPNTRFLGKF